MAEHRYRARGPENRTALITIRVTAADREGLHKLAAERGETLSRMLLAPWTGPKRSRSAKRQDSTRRSHEVVSEAPAEREPSVSAPQTQEPPPEAPAIKPARGRRVIPGQVELMLGDLGGEC